MTELNSQGREIWFRRVMWSYMPAHWKGVVYPATIVAIVVPLCLLANSYSPALSFILLFSGWAFVMWLCSRHSPARH